MPGLLSKYLSKKRTKIAFPYLKGHILDIGCGPARNLELLIDSGLPFESYTGLEYDRALIEKLKKQFPNADFYAVDLDEEQLPVIQKYDTIVLLAVVEHIFNLKFLFSQLSALLTEDGKIVLTTPTVFGNDIVHKIGTSIGLFDREGGQDDHIVIFNKKRLQILGNEVGLELISYSKFQLMCNQIAVFSKG